MRLIFKLILLVIIIVAALSWQRYHQFMNSVVSLENDTQIYTIKTGSNLQQVSNDLSEQGISELPAAYLYWYGRLNKKAHRIKAGQYTLRSGTTLPQLLEQFVEGKVVQHAFTIIEGMTTDQLLEKIQADTRLTHTLTDIRMETAMTAIGQADRHGEGEFAPETYYFADGTSDIELLSRSHQLMMNNLEQAWQNKADNLPYKNAYEALIMASIIEKETGIAEERPEIAGVFVRRLQKGMRLQTDPTVIYGIGKQFDGNIRRRDLVQDTPYNTYTRFGLPPTPIALPSKAAITAALHPAEGTSLYFVATGHEGRHIFSNTLVEHNNAVRKYQLKK